MNSITPVSLGQTEKPDVISKRPLLAYTKFRFDHPFETQREALCFCFSKQVPRSITFYCLLDSLDIPASALTVEKISMQEFATAKAKIKDSTPGFLYKKASGVNCYAFATGRVPLNIRQDGYPVPGAYQVEKIRSSFCLILGIANERNTTKAQLLSRYEGFNTERMKTIVIVSSIVSNLLDTICQERSKNTLEDKVNRFTESFFGKVFGALDNPENTEFHNSLSNFYQVPNRQEYMNPVVLNRLLVLDGLVKIYPNCDNSDFTNLPFGSVLLAAFVGKNNEDYHFMRYFRDGWYERVDDIEKNHNVQGIPFSQNLNEITEAFGESIARRNLSFVGYYIVPHNISLLDGTGKPFVLEYHKI